MYIFEKIFNWIFPDKLEKEYDYNPLNQHTEEEEEECRHDFRPVDSTGEILACIKCGFIVKLKDNYKEISDKNSDGFEL